MRRWLATIVSLALVFASVLGSSAHASHDHNSGSASGYAVPADAGQDHSGHSGHHDDCNHGAGKSSNSVDHKCCGDLICHGGFAILGNGDAGVTDGAVRTQPAWQDQFAAGVGVPSLNRPPIASIQL